MKSHDVILRFIVKSHDVILKSTVKSHDKKASHSHNVIFIQHTETIRNDILTSPSGKVLNVKDRKL